MHKEDRLDCITPTAESAWVDCLHLVNVTLLKVADILSCSFIAFFDLWILSLCHCLLTSSFSSEIFKSLSFRLDRLCHLAILCLDQHAHTLHHLEILLTIYLIRLVSLKVGCYSEFMRIQRISLRVSNSKRRGFLPTVVIRFTMLASSHYRNVSKQTTRYFPSLLEYKLALGCSGQYSKDNA
ncbi:hypothetical protein Tco_0752305 [Tanacetum coccineum]|uniref:Uncharacterized protein n=1 Tax=Tanacetum coccineum TaxID=301880 RepID=A0ABQ4Z6F7_9ASTR